MKIFFIEQWNVLTSGLQDSISQYFIVLSQDPDNIFLLERSNAQDTIR